MAEICRGSAPNYCYYVRIKKNVYKEQAAFFKV